MSVEQSGGRLDPTRVLALRFQLQYDDVAAFVRSYAGNLSPGGMFIATREPPAVGTLLRFEVVLADERPVLRGEGQVVWTADPTQESAAAPESEPLAGLGVRFGRLDAASRAVLAQALAHKAAHPEQFFTSVPDPYASAVARPVARRAVEPAPAATPATVQPPAAPLAAAVVSEPLPSSVVVSEPLPPASVVSEPPASVVSEPLPPASAASAPLPPSAASAPIPPSAASAPLPPSAIASAPLPPSTASAPLASPSAASAPLPPSAFTGEPLPPIPGLPAPSEWSPTFAALVTPDAAAEEEAALQSLLAPETNAALPTASDAARLLDELLDRRLG